MRARLIAQDRRARAVAAVDGETAGARHRFQRKNPHVAMLYSRCLSALAPSDAIPPVPTSPMPSSPPTATPAMRQYLDVKRQHRDAIVFFRMGDFYEMFYEDALVASRVLELTLTSRAKDASGGAIPMCGV